MFAYLKALFIKDVDALLADFTKVATRLSDVSEKLITEATQLQAVVQKKLDDAAKANKAANNIKGLVS